MRCSNSRFNLLLTEDRPHDVGEQHWTSQLPQLLVSQGVNSLVVDSGEKAIALAERMEIHAAVIDLATPRGHDNALPPRPGASSAFAGAGPGGLWLLELFRRLPNRPPVVLLRKPAYSYVQAQRLLREALRLGAFSVMNKPVEIEQLLAVFQRLVDRRYSGTWPDATGHDAS